MKNLVATLAFLAPFSAVAAPCLPLSALLERDTQYEEALRVGDVPFIEGLLADNFVWVHSLAALVDTKTSMLTRLKQPPVVPKTRTTSDVQAHTLGDTVVLRGVSTVELWNPDRKTFRSARYQFIRTYVTVEDNCQLLAAQTMKVWSSDGK